MNIDERLEALTQTLELTTRMHIDFEKTTEKSIKALTEAHAETEKTVNRLGRYAILIARDHEARLAALENGDEPAP
jgi:hypothetical protein